MRLIEKNIENAYAPRICFFVTTIFLSNKTKHKCVNRINSIKSVILEIISITVKTVLFFTIAI